MKIGAILGVIYMLEYMVQILTLQNVLYSFIHFFLSLSTPLLLAFAAYNLNKKICKLEFSWMKCWLFGLLVVFFASMLEAAYIIIYNQWIEPDNLQHIFQSTIDQLESSKQMLKGAGGAAANIVNETIAELKRQGVDTPFAAGIKMIPGNLFWGAIWMAIFACFFHHSYDPSQDIDENKENA